MFQPDPDDFLIVYSVFETVVRNFFRSIPNNIFYGFYKVLRLFLKETPEAVCEREFYRVNIVMNHYFDTHWDWWSFAFEETQIFRIRPKGETDLDITQIISAYNFYDQGDTEKCMEKLNEKLSKNNTYIIVLFRNFMIINHQVHHYHSAHWIPYLVLYGTFENGIRKLIIHQNGNPITFTPDFYFENIYNHEHYLEFNYQFHRKISENIDPTKLIISKKKSIYKGDAIALNFSKTYCIPHRPYEPIEFSFPNVLPDTKESKLMIQKGQAKQRREDHKAQIKVIDMDPVNFFQKAIATLNPFITKADEKNLDEISVPTFPSLSFLK